MEHSEYKDSTKASICTHIQLAHPSDTNDHCNGNYYYLLKEVWEDKDTP